MEWWFESTPGGMFDRETIWDVTLLGRTEQFTTEYVIQSETGNWFRMRSVKDPNVYVEVPFDCVGTGRRYGKTS